MSFRETVLLLLKGQEAEGVLAAAGAAGAAAGADGEAPEVDEFDPALTELVDAERESVR